MTLLLESTQRSHISSIHRRDERTTHGERGRRKDVGRTQQRNEIEEEQPEASRRGRSRLKDYSKFKADIGVEDSSRPREPSRSHRSVSRGRSRSCSRSSGCHQSFSKIQPLLSKCSDNLIDDEDDDDDDDDDDNKILGASFKLPLSRQSTSGCTFSGGRLSTSMPHFGYQHLEKEMIRIQIAVKPPEEGASEDYTFDHDNDDDSETTLESLLDPFGLEEDEEDHDLNSASTSSEISLSTEDLLSTSSKNNMKDNSCSTPNRLRRKNLPETDEDGHFRCPYTKHLFHQSMPMLGLERAMSLGANPDHSLPATTYQNQIFNRSTSATGHASFHHRSLPTLVLKEAIGNNDSSRSLTDFMERFDEDKRRKKSTLKSTGATTEDLRMELNQVAAVALHRKQNKQMPARSKIAPASATNHLKLHHSTGTLNYNHDDEKKRTLGSTNLKPKTNTHFARSKSFGDDPPALALIAAARHIPVPRFRRNRSSATNDNHNRWHNSTGQINFDYKEDCDQDNIQRQSPQPRRRIPQKSRSHDGSAAHISKNRPANDNSTSNASSASKCLPRKSKTISYTTTTGKSNHLEGGSSSNLNNSFVTGSRIRLRFSRGVDESAKVLKSPSPPPGPPSSAATVTRNEGRSLRVATRTASLPDTSADKSRSDALGPVPTRGSTSRRFGAPSA